MLWLLSCTQHKHPQKIKTTRTHEIFETKYILIHHVKQQILGRNIRQKCNSEKKKYLS